MTDKPYQPTIDEHGVGWCSKECSYYADDTRGERISFCRLRGTHPRNYAICEPWAIDAAKAKAAMDKLLAEGGCVLGASDDWLAYVSGYEASTGTTPADAILAVQAANKPAGQPV